MKISRIGVALTLAVLAVGLVLSTPLFAQRIDGDLRGTVKDPTGAVVPGAKITITNENTGVRREIETSQVGVFNAANLLPGLYAIEVEARGFRKSVRPGVEVFANRRSEANFTLEVGAATETVTVEAGAQLVTLTSATLVGATFKDELTGTVAAAGSLDGDPINLAITAPGTTTQSGGVVGTGGSIGGNRPRQNNFVIDGLDNNDPSVTGPLTNVIADAVAEFTLLTNQYSAEYGHSTAGQFITTTKVGTNDIHGRGWLYIQNRELNSFDNIQRANAAPGDPKPKFDWQRFGGQGGGPAIKDKLFWFGAYERQELDLAAVPGGIILVPTAAGFSVLSSLAADPNSGVSPVTAGIITSNVPSAGSASSSILVCDEGAAGGAANCGIAGPWQVPIELGAFSAATPNFSRENRYQFAGDGVTSKHRVSGRFSYNEFSSADTGTLPVEAFNNSDGFETYRVTVSDVFTISPTTIVETRAAWTRAISSSLVPDLPPGPGSTDVFANYNMQDISLNIGPQGNLPQSGGDNIYQLTNTWTLMRRAHTWKIGAEFRKIISISSFLPRSRGEYVYNAQASLGQLSDMDAFVRDFFPSGVAIRGVGLADFSADREAFYTFVQDSWKIHPRVTLELGLRYEFTTTARDSNLQNLNGLANITSLTDEVWTQELVDACGDIFCIAPFDGSTSAQALLGTSIFASLPARQQQALLAHVGTSVIFKEPKPDRNNFAPRVGLAWDLFGDGKTSLRAGAGIAHDVYFGNLPLLQLPPQAQAENRETNACLLSPSPAWCAGVTGGAFGDPTTSPGVSFSGIGFIEGGGLLDVLPGDALIDKVVARSATGAFIPNEISPETYTWSLSLQRELFGRMVAEARYVGTHAIHLPSQRWLSAGIPNPFRIPTFASISDAPSDFTGRPTLADFSNNRDLLLFAFGFGGVITMFTPDSRSTYHGGSISIRGDVGRGLFLNSNYTWSRTIDNIENDLFTSFMNPRRPWNHLNIFEAKGLSGLHHEHKLAISWSWEIPASGTSGALRKLAGGWNIGGSYIAETGQPLTMLARRDTNGDFDTAGDRAFVNSSASGSSGTDVSTLCFEASVVFVGTCASSATTVGYVADDSSARFVQPGTGSFPVGSLGQLGRNTFGSPGINNFNVSVVKNTPFWGEGRVIRFQADFINLFNHPSFIIGNGSAFNTTANARGFPGYVTPGSSQFRDKTIFSGGLGQAPFQRVIQLSLKVLF